MREIEEVFDAIEDERCEFHAREEFIKAISDKVKELVASAYDQSGLDSNVLDIHISGEQYVESRWPSETSQR